MILTRKKKQKGPQWVECLPRRHEGLGSTPALHSALPWWHLPVTPGVREVMVGGAGTRASELAASIGCPGLCSREEEGKTLGIHLCLWWGFNFHPVLWYEIQQSCLWGRVTPGFGRLWNRSFQRMGSLSNSSPLHFYINKSQGIITVPASF